MKRIKINKFARLMAIVLIIGWGAAGCGQKEADRTYAIVTKSTENIYNDLIVRGFRKVIEGEGGICLIEQPESATAETQIMIVKKLIQKNVDCIAIAANDSDGLEKVLMEAMDKGIKVSTFDSDSSPKSRMLFVNQVLEEEIGQTLMEAVYDMAGGEGQWAILSATSQAANQNIWMEAMKTEAEKSKYQNMRLVDIVYGNDEEVKSMNAARQLLEEHPDLKVICSPTVVGIKAACQVVYQEAPDRMVKVTGLGIPSQMESYIGLGDKKPCPYLYLWNPEDMGKLSAYVSLKLVEGSLSGAAGERFSTTDMGDYNIRESSNGGSQVILGEPLYIGPDNIAYWKDKI